MMKRIGRGFDVIDSLSMLCDPYFTLEVDIQIADFPFAASKGDMGFIIEKLEGMGDLIEGASTKNAVHQQQ